MSNMKRKPQPDPVDGIVTGGDNNDENLEDSKKKMRTEEDHCRVDGAAPPNTVSKRLAPKYGSKDYWEVCSLSRNFSFFSLLGRNSSLNHDAVFE